LIDFAEKEEIIQKTVRNFSNLKTLCFISLKLDVLSYECLKWVLISLRSNEMTPSERAIQSRIKEAFALKISMEIWNEIVSSIEDENHLSPVLKLTKDDKIAV
jgi:hypothetical protein